MDIQYFPKKLGVFNAKMSLMIEAELSTSTYLMGHQLFGSN